MATKDTFKADHTNYVFFWKHRLSLDLFSFVSCKWASFFSALFSDRRTSTSHATACTQRSSEHLGVPLPQAIRSEPRKQVKGHWYYTAEKNKDCLGHRASIVVAWILVAFLSSTLTQEGISQRKRSTLLSLPALCFGSHWPTCSSGALNCAPFIRAPSWARASVPVAAVGSYTTHFSALPSAESLQVLCRPQASTTVPLVLGVRVALSCFCQNWSRILHLESHGTMTPASQKPQTRFTAAVSWPMLTWSRIFPVTNVPLHLQQGTRHIFEYIYGSINPCW